VSELLSILVANTKGGCGKTTLATTLATAFAAAGHVTLLADVDPQRCSLGWLKRRPDTANPIAGIDWVKQTLAAPSPVTRLVIDCPAAMKLKQVEELLAQADAVVLPVLPSSFDETATRRFIDKLDTLKAIRKSRKAVSVVANRVRPRTKAAASLERFLAEAGHPVVARLHDSALYADLAAQGLGLFDSRQRRAQTLCGEWAPLLAHIQTES